MKYPVSAKEKAAIFYLLKRLSGHLKLSPAMKNRMRALRMKFHPGDAPVQLKAVDRDAILTVLYSVLKIGLANPTKVDSALCFQIATVIGTLENKEKCSSTSDTPPLKTDTPPA